MELLQPLRPLLRPLLRHPFDRTTSASSGGGGGPPETFRLLDASGNTLTTAGGDRLTWS
jgi:hypothetical protein